MTCTGSSRVPTVAALTLLFMALAVVGLHGLEASGQTMLAYENEVSITTDGTYRYISSNGIPDHPTGLFPNLYNPSHIAPQRLYLRMPLHPEASDGTWSKTHRPGVAVNGVLFDPTTAEYWNRDVYAGWNYEALTGGIPFGLDVNNAHVQPNGSYHYHAVPEGLLERLGKGQAVTLVGYAADGFPMYARYGYSRPQDAGSPVVVVKGSYRVRSGIRPSGPGGAYDGTFSKDWEYVAGLGDLDECNGRFGVTPEFPQGTYHYYVTDTYPYIPRMLRGMPDPSFGPPEAGGTTSPR